MLRKLYSCEESFNYVDDSTLQEIIVKSGSVWNLDKNVNITGKDIHLDCVNTGDWIEISYYDFKNKFKEFV